MNIQILKWVSMQTFLKSVIIANDQVENYGRKTKTIVK